jgi:maltose O-acetyltransferase
VSIGNRIRAAQAKRWLKGCAAIGDHPRFHGKPTIVAAAGGLRIGHRFYLSSRPVASHLVVGDDAALVIGSDVAIAHGAAVAAFERVEIGDGTCIGPFAIIMDTNFHGGSGDQSIQHDCRPVIIGRACRIGSRVTITRGVTIGNGAEILAGSVVSSSIPAGMCAGGARARVLGTVTENRDGWDSAAAVIPDLVRETLGLDATPHLDADPRQLPRWDASGVRELMSALEVRFRVRLEAEMMANAQRLWDIAAVVERLRQAGSEHRPPQA